MNIAFVTPQFIVGGAETYIIRKSQWLIEHGHHVLVISSGGCLVEMLPNEVKHIVLENLSDAPYSLPPKRLSQVLKSLKTILLDENIDVIEAHNTFPIIYVFMSYREHKIPFILNVLSELSYNSNWELQKITCVLDKLKCYYTLTKGMNDYIEMKCGHSLHPEILPIPLKSSSLINYNKNDFQNYILTVGRFSSDKMYLKYLIRDFGKLIDEHEDYSNRTLLIIGDGPLKNEMKQMADAVNSKHRRKAIILLGTVVGEELERFYAGCELYVGVGTTLLIAASYAKPSIIGGVYAQLQEYAFGFWGSYPEDKDLIAGSFDTMYRKRTYKEILDDFFSDTELHKKQYGHQAYNLFKSNYDLDTIMEKWNIIYSEHARKSMNGINNFAYYLYILNIALYPIYLLYRKIKFIYAKRN